MTGSAARGQARILIGGAGAAASIGFARSLRLSDRKDVLIGMNASPTDLLLADVDERHVVPSTTVPGYEDALRELLARTRPDFLHVQSDLEVARISGLRSLLSEVGVATFLPDEETIATCLDKWASYERWLAAGVPVPRTILVRGPDDLAEAFATLGGEVWLRETRGAGGLGSLRTDHRDLARAWIDAREAWGRFTAAEVLTERTVTWQSIWREGTLVVAQTRRRLSWAYGRNAPTGVSGITGVGETCSDGAVDDAAERAVRAVSPRPHGIYGVDLAYDGTHAPRATEINIGRFFTTHEFFARAGLNLPAIYVSLGLGGDLPALEQPLNPLPDGLLWIRGMDVEPALATTADLERLAR
jgi:hypothetical protein